MSADNQERVVDGLRRFQVVRCVVTGHRGRFGIEVSIVEPELGLPAFIDFALLSDSVEHVTPAQYPKVGAYLDAVVIDLFPSGELRLSAKPSSVARRRDVCSGRDEGGGRACE